MEAGDVARRVDVQGAVSGRALVVVFVTPHAADLCADLEDRYVQTGLRQILRRAQSASASADDGDAFVLWGLFGALLSAKGATSFILLICSGGALAAMMQMLACYANGGQSK